MSKKIVMVYPSIPPTFWNFNYALDFLTFKAVFPPLGLMTIAAMLPSDYEVKLVDMNVSELETKDILWADFVMISAMLIQQRSFTEVVKRCNELGRPVVAGGPYATVMHAEIKGVAHFVLNEAEITLPEFIADLEAGSLKPLYTSEIKPDLNQTPPPRFDLVNWNDYIIMPLQFSRGCPFNCEFCDIIEMLGRKPRSKPPERFIHEIDLLYDSGFRGQLFIVDDNFIGDRKKTKILLASLIDWQKRHDYPYQLFTEASIDMAKDDELIDLMVEAGFLYVFIGIETPNSETLKSINKKQNVDIDIHESVRKIQKKGIEVMGGFILGFDNDPDNIFELQSEFIRKAGIPSAMIGLLEAFPNTQLYRRLEKEGRLKKASSGNNMDLELNFTSKIPEPILIEGYKKLLTELYNPKDYLERCHTFIAQLPKKRLLYNMFHRTWRWQQFMGYRRAYYPKIGTFLICYLRILFTTTYGFKTIPFTLKLLLTNFFRFDVAFLLIFKGYHYSVLVKNLVRGDLGQKRG